MLKKQSVFGKINANAQRLKGKCNQDFYFVSRGERTYFMKSSMSLMRF